MLLSAMTIMQEQPLHLIGYKNKNNNDKSINVSYICS